MKFLPTRLSAMLALVWLAICGGALDLPGQEEENVFALSQRRVETLRRLTAEHLAGAGLDADENQAAREILRRFRELEPGCPTGEIAGEPREDAAAEAAAERIVAELVGKRFPPLDEEEVWAEARERYPIYRKGDVVDFYYATNPQNIRRARGIYAGRNVRLIQVGASAIQVEDIARVQGNEEVVLRFDSEASEELRRAYVAERRAEYERAREAYRNQALAYTRSLEIERLRRQNQADGYLFFNWQWTTARELVEILIGEEKGRLEREAREAFERQLARKRQRLANAADRQASREHAILAAVYADVDAAQAAYRERLAAAKPEPVVEDVPEDEPPEDEPPTEDLATQPPHPPPAAPPAEPDTVQFLPVWAYGAIAGILLVAVIIGIVAWRRRAAGPANELKKFFQGRGKVQRTFWQMAEDSPETFKYVAYRYSSAQEARQALLQLSYVNERVGGDLVCRHDVYFGFGPHQDKFIAFVGGEKLNYALWREASAVLPEYPGAEYFRVSTAPEVNVEIPNLDTLLADAELQIEHLENREGEGTDYSHYYVYRAPGKENAMEFLKHASIQEAGVHVIVLTMEGVFGKDENGIYEESPDLWAERYPEVFEE